MSALEKIVALASPAPATREDPAKVAAVLVQAALSDLAELRVLLATPDDEDDDGDDGKGGNSHSGHSTYKKLVAKGMSPKMAGSMCAKADKKVSAAALTEAAVIALSGLAAAEGDWAEMTALDRYGVMLAGKTSEGGPKKPYGDVQYADPGYQKDGKKRYPVDTPEHCRAALSYVSQKDNASKYSPDDLAKIKAAIRRAAARHGIKTGDAEKVEASYVVELAAKGKVPAGPAQNMRHGPFTGAHSHGHPVQQVHEHDHFHNNDNSHDYHAHGGDGKSGQETYSPVRDW